MRIGMLGRFFAGNWRPPVDEIAWAAANGFDALQIRSDRPGEIAGGLRAEPAAVGAAFEAAGVEPVLEMLVFHDGAPGAIPAALRANLPAIEQLGCRRVHVHPVGSADAAPLLAGELAEALDVALAAGLVLGVEHNAPGHRLLVTPEECRELLDAVAGLHLVWDLNHMLPRHVAGFEQLRDRLSLVHVSDTPLPETNHHLPLGRGSVDFGALLRGVDVPLILEIGGLPISGGPGFDTDEELLDSLARLRSLA